MSSGDNLSPGDTTAAPFILRLDEKTTSDAVVNFKSAGLTAGKADGLTYGITQVDSADACTANLKAGLKNIVQKGTPLGQKAATSQSFDLAQGPKGAAGEEAILCFQVTADDNLEQSQTANATWAFDAISQ